MHLGPHIERLRQMRDPHGAGHATLVVRAGAHHLGALTVWGAVLIVALSIVSDLLVMSTDPRIRASGRIG